MSAKRSWSLIAVLLVAGSAAWAQERPYDSDEAESGRLRKIAAVLFGEGAEADLQLGAERNFVALRSKELLLSTRTDSRTFFAQDERGVAEREYDPKAASFEGSDRELLRAAHRVLWELGVPSAEVAEGKVLTERTRVGRVDATSGKLEDVKEGTGKRWAQFTRSVDGIPVFSSRALLLLDARGRVRFLEVHWPVVGEAALAEARRLGYMAKRGFKPPELPGARPESIDVGIVHSPGAGFVLDLFPAIRVVYAPLKPELGRKPVLYLDRSGRPVPTPRTFEETPAPPAVPRRGKSGK